MGDLLAGLSTKRTLLGIQAGRGIAALLVVLFHAERALTLPQYVGHDPLGGTTSFGHAGVDFFFVLSGFIIFYVHGEDIGQPRKLFRYAKRRALRIYPPYWIVTTILLLVGIVAHGSDVMPSPVHLAQILMLTPGDHDLVLGVAWTLVREAVFYVLFGLAIVDRRLAVAAVVTCLAAGWVPALRFWSLGWFDLLFVIGIGAAWVILHAPVWRPWLLAALGMGLFLASGLAEDVGLLPMTGPQGRIAYGVASGFIIVGLVQLERGGQLRVGPALSSTGRRVILHLPRPLPDIGIHSAGNGDGRPVSTRTRLVRHVCRSLVCRLGWNCLPPDGGTACYEGITAPALQSSDCIMRSVFCLAAR